MSAKLTRAEACAELARRLGWTCDNTLGSFTHKLWRNPNQQVDYPENWQECPPDYFTSRDAAAELVLWLTNQGGDDFLSFYARLERTLKTADIGHEKSITDWEQMRPAEYRMIAFTLATPERIALAACAALGLELEDAAK